MMALKTFTDEQIKTFMRPTIKAKNGNMADIREEIIETMFNSPCFRKNVSRTHPFRQELHEAVRNQMRPLVATGVHNFSGEDQTLEIRKTQKTKGYDFDIYLNEELQLEKLEHKLSKPKKHSKGVYYDVPQMMNFQLNKALFSKFFVERNGVSYASFVWERYLPRVSKLYGVTEELPTKRAYSARCGQIVSYDKETSPFIKQIRTIHKEKGTTTIENLAKLNRLSKESFIEYFEEELDLDLEALLAHFKEANQYKLVLAQYDDVNFKLDICKDIFELDTLRFTDCFMEAPLHNTRNAHHAILTVETNKAFKLELTFRWMNGLWQHNPAVKFSVVAVK